jgi:HSF-type DNA-binding
VLLLLRIGKTRICILFKSHIEKSRAKDLEHYKSNGGPKVPFPSTLHRLLDEVEDAGHASIVGWLPHGRAFKVQNQELFVTAVLPLYFKLQSSYNSFLRQLNVYGFRRLVGPHQDQNAYYHEYFLRSRIHLCTLMTRYTSSTSTTGGEVHVRSRNRAQLLRHASVAVMPGQY